MAISSWYCGTGSNVWDHYHLKVLLLDAERRSLAVFDPGEQLTCGEWHQEATVINYYGSGLRYIRWEESSSDSEYGQGLKGVRVDDCLLAFSSELPPTPLPTPTITPTPHNVNLLINPGAEEMNLDGWTTWPPSHGWVVTGSEYHSGLYSFLTSYNPCDRHQVIDLLAAGYSEEYLDSEPVVEVSEWYKGTSADTGDTYRLSVELRDASSEVIADFTTGVITTGANWSQAYHEFSGYGPGLRYIYFEDFGQAAESFSGSHGAAIDDGSVILDPYRTPTPMQSPTLTPTPSLTNTPTVTNTPSPGPSDFNLLENPGAEFGDLSGWTILEAGPDGWGVTTDESYTGIYSFIMSCPFCRRVQAVDLVDYGFLPEDLDAAPDIYVSEMFKGSAPEYNDGYFLKVELFDSNLNLIDVYDSGWQTGTESWVRLEHTFSDYGPGVRYVHFQDGGEGQESSFSYYGAKSDDAWLAVDAEPVGTTPTPSPTLPPTHTFTPTPLTGPDYFNLLVNPSMEWGNMEGWHILDGIGRWGITDEAAHEGAYAAVHTTFGARKQEINLAALGFTSEQLDAEPVISVSEWYRGRPPDYADNFFMTVQLRDSDREPIAEFSTGYLTASEEWLQTSHNFTDYGPGVRYIYFEDGGESAEGLFGQDGEIIDEAYVVINVSVTPTATPTLTAAPSGTPSPTPTLISRWSFKNLLTNPSAETQNLEGWNILAEGGDGWSTTSEDFHHDWRSFITSWDWCVRSQEIDLVAMGYSPDLLDSAPIVQASEWYRGHDPNYNDIFKFRIELRNEAHEAIASHDTGELVADNKWRHTSASFSDYGQGLRYLYWEDAGRDVEYYSGYAGVKIDDAWLYIVAPTPAPTVTVTDTPAPTSTPQPTATPSPSATPQLINILTNPGAEQGNLDGWTIESGPWAVSSNARSGQYSFYLDEKGQTSTRSQDINLLFCGYDAAELDASPDILVSEWIKNNYPRTAWFRLKVELLDMFNEVITSYDSGQITPSYLGWQYVGHTFADYGSDLRFIRWEEEAYYGLFDYYPAPFIDDASLRICTDIQPVWTPSPSFTPSPDPNSPTPTLTPTPNACNLLVNPSMETGDCEGWTILHACGGPGHVMNDAETYHGQWAVQTTANRLRRCQEIDLIAMGFLPAELDSAPDVAVFEWFRNSGIDYIADTFYMKVELRDASHATIAAYDSGVLGVYDQWEVHTCNLSGYGPGLRYIYFEDGGMDGQHEYAAFIGTILDHAFVGVLGVTQPPPTATPTITMTPEPTDTPTVTNTPTITATMTPTGTPTPLTANLLENPGAETGDLTGWTVLQGGGAGWAVRTDEIYEGGHAFATSEVWNTRSQEVDLAALGFSPSQLDAAPAVHAHEWFRGANPLCNDRYYLLVELRDAGRQVIASYYSDELLAYNFWKRLSHVFTDYGPGLRYIYWEDGGRGVESWSDHHGALLDAAWLSVDTAYQPSMTPTPANSPTPTAVSTPAYIPALGAGGIVVLVSLLGMVMSLILRRRFNAGHL